MAYVLSPTRSVHRKLPRIAVERLDDALERLDGLDGADPADVEEAVHEVRKRCKEARGLAQLVRPALGSQFGSFDGLVRRAAAELSSIRDAHAVLDTFDHLLAANADADDHSLDRIRAHLIAGADDATLGIVDGDARLEQARLLLRQAREEVSAWSIPRGFSPLAEGLSRTYRRGARSHAKVRRRATDERVHEWRKAAKHLWYQMRLLERAAPSIIAPLVGLLDDLADALGDDHDLAVLVEHLEADPGGFGGEHVVGRARDLARAQQSELREGAVRLGDTIYAESGGAFVERIGRYWNIAVNEGPERDVGSIETLAEARRTDRDERAARSGGSTVERERKWLITEPLALTAGTVLRQGYLAIDRSVSVRVRDAGDEFCTLTLKAGQGAVRSELEWPIERATFEQAWPLTDGRRVAKTRYRRPCGDHTAEVDVFDDSLTGLVMAEVEFADDDSMGAFVPPEWFGREVSDDIRYTNASLAVHGLDPALFT